MKYRLALDMGTNSIGWAVIRLRQGEKKGKVVWEPVELVRIGSRIFSNSKEGAGRHPKTGDSLGAERRGPRSARRNRDRYIQRRDALLKYLTDYGLFPAKGSAEAKLLQQQNPYELRAQGLDEALTPYELGRAIFHLNQRRGFKSNRKTDAGDNESGKIKQAIAAFKQEMANAATVGEVLYERLRHGGGTRARLHGSGKEAAYELYVERSMVEQEFDQLWQAQAVHHPELLTEDKRAKLFDIIFRQRPLKPVPVGKCTFNPDEERAPKALPSAQRFRYYQEVNNLELINTTTGEATWLSQEQLETLYAYLERRSYATYEQLRQQLFGKEKAHYYRFTKEESSTASAKVPGNSTAHKLAHKEAFGSAWQQLDLSNQDRIVEQLLAEEDEQKIINWLMQEYQVSREQADYIGNKVRLEDSHFRLGRTAVKAILPYLQQWNTTTGKATTFDQAVKQAGYQDHRIVAPDDEHLLDELPHYQEVLWRYCQDMPTATAAIEKEYGRITNPTVHIALNQLRLLVNALIKKYGNPTEIHIEMARELKKNRKAKLDWQKQQNKNRELNDSLNAELRELGVLVNYSNRIKLKLFHELQPLNHCCVLSGTKISRSQLFSDNNSYQIDHILPYSKTLDDGFNNKILVTRKANADKSNKTIEELCLLDGYDFDEIQSRIASLPYAKRKRFNKDALKEWQGSSGEFVHDGADFAARQLNDTAYLSRVAREYLQTICPARKIVTLPGTLTGMLRGKWGLNKLINPQGNFKNRHDHRHHAIDAAVISIIDRSLIQKIQTLAARLETDETHLSDNLLKGVDGQMPWDTYRDELAYLVNQCVVSHKPDHNPQGKLHEDTAYGVVDGPDDKDVYTVRNKVALSALKPKDISALQHPDLAQRIQQVTEGLSEKAMQEKLASLAGRKGWPRKAYILRKISGVAVALKGTALSPDLEKRPINPAKIYRGGANYCYEICIDEKGKWDGKIISTFVANQKPYRDFMQNKARFKRYTFDGKPLVMRLINNDMVILGHKQVMRVQKMTDGVVTLCEHVEANVDARSRDKQDSFAYTYKSPNALKTAQARKATISILGKINDPGFTP